MKNQEAGEDASSLLVGCVVEKGFSDENSKKSPPYFPSPTFLPFPVARHRSHGPHWNPIPHQNHCPSAVEDDDQLSGYNPISVLANPLQRKEKKGMDFTKWRKIITDKSNAVTSMDGNGGSVLESKSLNNINNALHLASDKSIKHQLPNNGNHNSFLDKEFKDVSAMKMLTKELQETSDMDISSEPNNSRHIPSTERSAQTDVTLKNGVKEKVNTKMSSYQPEFLENIMEVNGENPGTSLSYTDSRFTPYMPVTEEGAMDIESQIDAQNHALLERMSAHEISDAHAEIISKMQPELIQVLRRRGQEKLKRKNDFGSDTNSSGEVNKLESGKGNFNASTVSVIDSSDEALKEKLKTKEKSILFQDQCQKEAACGIFGQRGLRVPEN